MQIGHKEGDTCGRDGCDGKLAYSPIENCSCHIAPPCSACTSSRLVCSECDWEQPEEPPAPAPAQARRAAPPAPGRRPTIGDLDPTKIDWISRSHSSCSMIVDGVYPPGTTMEQVRALVDGTFGGRFTRFVGGRFTFIAYTD